MLGLAVIVFFVFYLAALIGITIFAFRWAKNRCRRPWLWGGLAAFIMYNFVFWDYLPTMITFKYLVHTKAGFWVYKTPKQWKEDNQGVAETLTWQEKVIIYKAPGIKRGQKLNERIGWVIKEHQTPILGVTTKDELLIDIQSNETLVQRTTIYSGSSATLRFWTIFRQPIKHKKEYNSIWNAYMKLGRRK